MSKAIASYQKWLESFLSAHGGIAGSVHLQRGEDLELVAAQNLPPPVVATVRHVPRGKGMAGLAQVRKEPVQTCNLKEDDSGNVKPGAKAVNAKAAIAMPVLDSNGEVRAVVGIAFMHEGEIPAEQERAMMADAAKLPAEDA